MWDASYRQEAHAPLSLFSPAFAEGSQEVQDEKDLDRDLQLSPKLQELYGVKTFWDYLYSSGNCHYLFKLPLQATCNYTLFISFSLRHQQSQKRSCSWTWSAESTCPCWFRQKRGLLTGLGSVPSSRETIGRGTVFSRLARKLGSHSGKFQKPRGSWKERLECTQT